MSGPDIVFAAPPGAIRDKLWSEQARQTAERLGLVVRLNPHAGPMGPADWAALFSEADAIITTWGSPRLNGAVLGQNRRLRIVGHAAGSVAGVVSAELFSRGVRVVTANRVMARAVAEWSLMMTLVGRRQLTEYAQLPGSTLRWERRELAGGLHDATIAIWGFGDVARQFVGMLAPLRPGRIIVHSEYLSAAEAESLGVEKVGFDELFVRGDVIHLLEGLTPQTAGRVGPAQLAAIRDGAVLINAGRANLVQAEALLAEAGKGRFLTILDVHYTEPPPEDDPFRRLPNVILTPHCAGGPGAELYVGTVLEEFGRFFRGEPLQFEITAERAATMTDESIRAKAGA